MALKSILDHIGNTPLLELNFAGRTEVTIYAKAEYLNPSGSTKDRIAKYMIEQAEKRGELKPGYVIVEATTGNAGISFAMVAAAKGYKIKVFMPEIYTTERTKIMEGYGAEMILTPGEEFVEGSIRRAKKLCDQPEYWMPAQFSNYDNVAAHRETTGREIWEQTEGKVDAFVAGVGTGGTIMGVAEALRERNPNVKIIGVEPAGAPVFCGGLPSPNSDVRHKIEGIGDGFVPDIVNMSQIDDWIKVRDEDAISMTQRLIKERGLFVGISSGANVFATLHIAKLLGKNKTVVTVLPDSADRYYNTELF